MLDEDEVVRLLVARGVVQAESIITGSLRIEQASRRNRNLALICEDNGAGVFVKQPEAHTVFARESLVSEGDFYVTHGCRADLTNLVPKLELFDRALPLLALGIAPGSKTLSAYCEAYVAPGFPIRIWRDAGRALGQVHRALFASPVPGTRDRSDQAPYVSSLHRPALATVEQLGAGGLRVREIIQSSPTLMAGLDSVGDLWTAEAIVHGDVRADNILIKPSDNDRPIITFADWEMCRWGDVAWDVAGLIEAVVGAVISNLHATSSQERGSYESAFAGLLQAACRAMWGGYCASRQLVAEQQAALAVRSIVFAATRVVQVSAETANVLETVPGWVIDRLQISENILADPQVFAKELLGT